MKLLTVLMFVSTLAIQAKAQKHVHAKDYYLSAGTSFQLSSPKEGTTFKLVVSKGVILKKKYDFSLSLNYAKNPSQKSYGAGLSSKYLLKALNKTSKTNPYVAFFVGLNKGQESNSKLSLSLGNRFFVSPQMAIVLNLEYAKTTSNTKEVTELNSVVSWSYFF